MKIKLSKSQWEFIGRKASWFSKPEDPTILQEPELNTDKNRSELVKHWFDVISKDFNKYFECPVKIQQHPAIEALYNLKKKDTI